jgi:hypothetical protein
MAPNTPSKLRLLPARLVPMCTEEEQSAVGAVAGLLAALPNGAHSEVDAPDELRSHPYSPTGTSYPGEGGDDEPDHTNRRRNDEA